MGAPVLFHLGSIFFLKEKWQIWLPFFLYLRVVPLEEGEVMSDFGFLILWKGCRSNLFNFWSIKIPKKVRFVTWQVLLGLLGHTYMMDRLVRKMSLLVEPFCCIVFSEGRGIFEPYPPVLWVHNLGLGFFIPNIWCVIARHRHVMLWLRIFSYAFWEERPFFMVSGVGVILLAQWGKQSRRVFRGLG